LSSATVSKEEIQPFSPSTLQPLQLPSTSFNPLQPVQPVQPNMFLVEKLKSLKVEIDEFNPSTHQPSSTFQPPSTLQQPPAIVKTPEESVTDKLFAIRLLANAGHLEEALSICNDAIGSYKLSSGLYFLRASILQELDKTSEAIVSLKQAIYIEPDYIMGHFALGNLFIRQGNTRNAERCFNNVLDLLSRCAKDDILPESEGLSVKFIREIIFTNMQTQLTK
jgi:chemotaxis protein methyltransferase CheR